MVRTMICNPYVTTSLLVDEPYVTTSLLVDQGDLSFRHNEEPQCEHILVCIN